MTVKDLSSITFGQMMKEAETELDVMLQELKTSILTGDLDKRHKTIQEILKHSASINNLLKSAKKVKQ